MSKVNIPGTKELDNLEVAQQFQITQVSLNYELVDFHYLGWDCDLRYAMMVNS